MLDSMKKNSAKVNGLVLIQMVDRIFQLVEVIRILLYNLKSMNVQSNRSTQSLVIRTFFKIIFI